MGRTDRRDNRSIRRATDELLLARLLGVEQAASAARDARSDEQLLSELLLAPEAQAASRRLSPRTLLLAVAAMLALFSCVPLASAAGSLLAIRDNVAAMRLATVERQPAESGTFQPLYAKRAAGQAALQPDAAQPVGDVNAARAATTAAAPPPSSKRPLRLPRPIRPVQP